MPDRHARGPPAREPPPRERSDAEAPGRLLPGARRLAVGAAGRRRARRRARRAVSRGRRARRALPHVPRAPPPRPPRPRQRAARERQAAGAHPRTAAGPPPLPLGHATPGRGDRSRQRRGLRDSTLARRPPGLRSSTRPRSTRVLVGLLPGHGLPRLAARERRALRGRGAARARLPLRARPRGRLLVGAEPRRAPGGGGWRDVHLRSRCGAGLGKVHPCPQHGRGRRGRPVRVLRRLSRRAPRSSAGRGGPRQRRRPSPLGMARRLPAPGRATRAPPRARARPVRGRRGVGHGRVRHPAGGGLARALPARLADPDEWRRGCRDRGRGCVARAARVWRRAVRGRGALRPALRRAARLPGARAAERARARVRLRPRSRRDVGPHRPRGRRGGRAESPTTEPPVPPPQREEGGLEDRAPVPLLLAGAGRAERAASRDGARVGGAGPRGHDRHELPEPPDRDHPRGLPRAILPDRGCPRPAGRPLSDLRDAEPRHRAAHRRPPRLHGAGRPAGDAAPAGQ